jgi:uncharacterized membrane protein
MAVAPAPQSAIGSHKSGHERTRVEMSEPLTVRERIADNAAALVGSWRFIIIQTILVGLWVILNIVAWEYKWDPYPLFCST